MYARSRALTSDSDSVSEYSKKESGSANFDFLEWFERQFARHPNKRERTPSERVAATSFAAGEFTLEDFEEKHIAWCDSEGWQWKSGARAPTLGAWITDKGFRYDPPERCSERRVRHQKGDAGMISIAFAADQLERLMGMIGFPKGKESERYIIELRQAIESSRSEKVAAQVVTDILRNHKRFPSVSDIYDAVSEENSRYGSKESYAAPSYGCQQCNDFGFFGGHLPPHPESDAWQWCVCGAANRRKFEDPDTVAECNRVRQLPISKFPDGKIKLRKVGGLDPQELREDRYFGEF